MVALPSPPNRPLPGPAEAWLAANRPLLVVAARDQLRRAGGCPDDAEDAAQEAALAIWRHWADCRDDPAERRTWAAHVARNAARDRAAWTRRRPATPLSALPGLYRRCYGDDPDAAAAGQEHGP